MAVVLFVNVNVIGWKSAKGEEAQRISFITSRGESIENAKILRVDPDGISVMHAHGISKIPVEELPDDLQARFRLNASRAAQFRAQQSAAIRARDERVRTVVAQQQEEQRVLDAERAAERAERNLADEEAKKKRANYAWHPGGGEIIGSVLLVEDGMVLIQIANRVGNAGKCVCRLSDLPALERERALWIGERLTIAERRQGERVLADQLHYLDARAMRIERSHEQAQRAIAEQEFRGAVRQGVEDAIRHMVW